MQGLIDRFAEHCDAYLASGGGGYNETQLRREFLDPLFGLQGLGWDIDNNAGYAEAYKDVIHEDAIKVGGATKAPDYSFRIGGVRKFFLEAKKPSVDIKGDPGPAYQLRRYAWSAKLPLSILSDFEEFAVYDCRIKPAKGDKPSVGRVMYFTFDQFAERWDEFASIFSQQAILKGSFDKYAESTKRKRGTAEVDTAFLEEIEQWRDSLARNLALRNDDLNQRDLNFAVQRTIDRIIFLRICEDRGVEQYGTLQGLVNGDHVYDRLFERFRRADERYNSGLFHFDKEKGRPESPDDLTPGLSVDDKTLKDILARLYYPDSPYEFSVLPADILGQVYEQFLGKVIRLTKGHRAIVEEKPEVRKAGGVYYTPTYIVDYIVKHTVGKLVEGKPPQQVAGLTDKWQPSKSRKPITVLDPACGSGSFLLGAYQFLLDWYRDQYIADSPKKHTGGKMPRLYQRQASGGGDYRLTTAERKRILTSHIFGVDIDSQAVETTKLSLLLKVLEGENAETLGANLRLFHERALPDLAQNIKCGNSLIGSDFYDNQQIGMFDEEERLRINVFDWKVEFKSIMDGGGFDAVIGNPPYRKERDSKELIADLRTTEWGSRYYQGKMDFWYFFLHRGLELTQTDGFISFIVSSYWLKSTGATKLIAHLRSDASFRRVVDFCKNKVFQSVTGRHMIFVLARTQDESSITHQVFDQNKLTSVEIASELKTPSGLSTQRTTPTDHIFNSQGGIDLGVGLPPTLVNRLNTSCVPMGEHPLGFEVSQGIVEATDVVTSKLAEKFGRPEDAGKGVFVLTNQEEDALAFNPKELAFIKPYTRRRDVSRYRLEEPTSRVLYLNNASNKVVVANRREYPELVSHLDSCQHYITSSNAPYGLHRARDPRFFRQPKLLCPNMFDRTDFVFCEYETYVNFAFNVIVSTNEYNPLNALLAILNSSFGNAWFNVNAKKRGVNNDVGVAVLRRFPLPKIASPHFHNNPKWLTADRLASGMLDLHKQLADAKTGHGKTAIQRQIDATDRQIDQLVYELYGLSDEEIAIVEDAVDGG